MHIFYQPDIAQGAIYLDPEESAHCCTILRHKVGDKIHIADGVGSLFEASIATAHPKKCLLDHVSLLRQVDTPPSSVHLAIAPTKNMDRIEWLVEKACELGVGEISFVQCRHSERKVLKTDRLVKKTVSALKQSKNLFKTKIGELETFKSFVGKKSSSSFYKAIAVVENGNLHLFDALPHQFKSALILIGPEGDFSKEEIEQAQKNGYQKVGLGDAILRTETAGLIACHTAQLKMR